MQGTPNGPRGREKNITGPGKGVERRGEGLGTGPVGHSNGYEAKKQTTQNSRGFYTSSTSTSSNTGRAKSGGLLKIIIVLVILLGGGGGIAGILGNNSSNNSNYVQPQSIVPSQTDVQPQTQPVQPTQQSSSFNLNNVYGNISSGTSSSGWIVKANTGTLDNTVAKGTRSKYTTIKGGGKDTVTVMVYMCGADLESKSGLASADVKEMCNATIGSNVNVILYTGGTTKWHNSVMNESVNQIYKVETNGITCLSKDEGNVAMTKPETLSGFIKYCKKNYPANRFELIFWDHGGGSLSGYGYDEKFKSSGSMTLAGINTALKDGGVQFDFVGFDACLMATAETGLMLSPYADYMIASEEVEPGYGWYYTNWLTALSNNTSMATIEIGKQIADDFIESCAQSARGQKATLSVTDLAELDSKLPNCLKDFALSTSEIIKSDYTSVADARNSCREFSTSSIDQVDLVNLAVNMDTEEGNDLANAVLGAVKYNRCSTNMTNAYGLSIYFPYKKAGKVSTAVNTYEAIGLDDEYSRCIEAFAGVAGAAQGVQSNAYQQYTGGAMSILPNIGGLGLGGSQSSISTSSGTGAGSDLIFSILGSMLSDRSVITEEEAARIIEDNSFDASALYWNQYAENYGIKLSAEQWNLVRGLNLNVFYDDGKGYIDLGLDNVFNISEDGTLSGDFDGTWIAIDGQPVAYYHMDTIDDGENYTITGRVPAFLNGERVNLILVFDNENPYGYIAGASTDYRNAETETIAKNLLPVKDGDAIDFLCDYYDYDGNYQDSFILGDQLVINGKPEISNVYLPDSSAAYYSYVFSDIFMQEYWTPVLQGKN